MENMEKIVIKCFTTLKKFYFYDRCKNCVVSVTPEEYIVLKRVEEEGKIPEDTTILDKYLEKGLLQKKKAIKIEHPLSDDITYYTDRQLKELILQVTQQCNLRCSYCTYSGKYYNREHSDKKMSFNVARKAIDFYFEHSTETDQLNIAFYGGEPLLEFPLIKKCVEYAEKKVYDKKLNFFITTNGTLLTDEVILFMIKHRFAMTISLDGGKEEHDVNRKFRNGKGSFDIIVKNLQRLRDYDEKYFLSVGYNTVINSNANLKNVLDYFAESNLFNPMQVRLSMVNETGILKNELFKTDEIFWIPHRYEHLKVLLYLLGKIDGNYIHPLYKSDHKAIELFYKEIQQHHIEMQTMHHGGPCMPGARRMFVNIEGDIYPCEKVSESINGTQIGRIEEGFDYKKIYSILNIGQLTEKECLECWNLRLCKMCIGQIEPIDNKLICEGKLISCRNSIDDTLYSLKEMCVLIENGYHFHEEEFDG